MLSSTKLVALAALLPSVLACLGYTGGLPKATSTKTNSKVIVVAAGAVFDGGWAKYDRGSGACNEQAEGGEKYTFTYENFFLFLSISFGFICRLFRLRSHA